MMLARLDNVRDFHLMLDEANRNGVTFYPIDIRGLTVEGTMNRRGDSLITLATATDGIAVINSNSFTPALRRINEDLASYYLLGYYPSNTKMDGTFRKIDVKVKRPGVKLRARRGYLAPTAGERAELAKAAPAMPDPDADTRERALRQLDGEQDAAAGANRRGLRVAGRRAGEARTRSRRLGGGRTGWRSRTPTGVEREPVPGDHARRFHGEDRCQCHGDPVVVRPLVLCLLVGIPTGP